MEEEVASTSKLPGALGSGRGHTQKDQRNTANGAARIAKIFLSYVSLKRKQGSNSKRAQLSSPMDTPCKSPYEMEEVDLLTPVEAKDVIVVEERH